MKKKQTRGMFKNDPGYYLTNANIRYHLFTLLHSHCDPLPFLPYSPSINIKNILNYNTIYKRADQCMIISKYIKYKKLIYNTLPNKICIF